MASGEVYRYDDNGEPIILSDHDRELGKLWKSIGQLDLPHLKPTTEKEASFDPALFFQKISWAHAELNVALDLIDTILVKKTMKIQPVSNHGHRPPKPSPMTDNIALAKQMFRKAADDIRLSDDATINERLIATRKEGWPLFKRGLAWILNYGYQTILNLPLTVEHEARIDPESLALLNVQHTMFLKVSGSGGSVCMVREMENFSANDWTKALVSSLDTAFFQSLLTGNQIQAIGEDMVVIKSERLGLLRFEMVKLEDSYYEMSDPELLAFVREVYQKFIFSRGSTAIIS